jgi:hypothetical protein
MSLAYLATTKAEIQEAGDINRPAAKDPTAAGGRVPTADSFIAVRHRVICETKK